MKASFKTRLIRTIVLLIIGFLALFIFRFIYGYSTGLAELQEEDFSNYFTENDNIELKRNYASDHYKFLRKEAPTDGAAAQSHQFDVSQKYEKTATVKTRSKNFDKDEQKIRNTIKKFNAIIQYEQNAGVLATVAFISDRNAS